MDDNNSHNTPPTSPLLKHSHIHNLSPPSQPEHHHHHHGVNLPSTSILIIIISVVFVVVVVALFLLIQKLRSLKSGQEKDKSPSVLKRNNSGFIAHSSVLSFNSTPDVGNRCLHAGSLSRKPPTKSRGVQLFTYRELEMATDGFNEANVIENGRGGDGDDVYRGVLNDGIVAAIKMMHREDKQMERAFRIEVDLLSRLRSPYLIELLGYCADQNHRLLIFEFMPLGTLQQHLHPSLNQQQPLDWGNRLRIALDCARALEYLHEHASPSVIHRDFKSSNVLLDQNFRAKVSDFGLAKTGSDKINGQISTRVLGTTGYLAPEYASTGKLTTKSDVYSYGVVLLELLTGRVPVDSKRPPGEHVLVSWALPRLTNREKVVEMVDPALQGQYPKKDLIQIAAIAAVCVQPEADYRPLMTDVVQSLLPLVKNNFSVGSSSSYRFLDQTGSPRP